MDIVTVFRRLDSAVDRFSEEVSNAAGIITGAVDNGDGSGIALLSFYGEEYYMTLTPVSGINSDKENNE